jgi:DNA-binding beta-propeller fold protein YncE
VIALALAVSVLLLVTVGALAVTGDLTQPGGAAGCVSHNGAGGCRSGFPLNGAFGVAVSPDGKNVYVAASDSDAIVRLNRNTTTGQISQPPGGCISETGAGPCADGHALNYPTTVAVSPDGKSLYVASVLSDAVVRFNRNTTAGGISQPPGTTGCVSETGAGTCAPGHALDGALGLAVSPDGKNVYVTSNPDGQAVVRLERNTTTGAISQPAGTDGCISETGAGTCVDGHALITPHGVAISPDGKSLYVASHDSDSVARLDRNTTTGEISQPAGTDGCVSWAGFGAEPCADGHAIQSPHGLTVSPDGKNVYVASTDANAVVRLNRNLTTGAITQPVGTAGCVSETGAGPCTNGHALFLPFGVAVSPGGNSLYAASRTSEGPTGAVARFNRSTTAGGISQPPGTTGCVSETGAGTCADGRALKGATSLAFSPNGRSVYAASTFSDAVARFIRTP